MPRAPRLYFSFRSPFSWLTIRQLSKLAPDELDELELIPFWDPDEETSVRLEQRGARFHYQQMSKAKHLYILGDTRRITQRLGVNMCWPVDRDPHWEIPHLAWLQAQRDGQDRVLYQALVEARWGRGEDICDEDALRRLADDAGLDGAALASAHRDEEIRAESVECLVRAYHDDIFGIPYILDGRHRFWGLDRVGWWLSHRRGTDHPVDLGGLDHTASDDLPLIDTDTPGGCG